MKTKDYQSIKTFENALIKLGEQHPFVRSYFGYMDYVHKDGMDDVDVLAYLKLRIVCEALNDGWKPKFTKNEVRYYPLLWLCNGDEIKEMDEDGRNRLVLFGGAANIGSKAGFAYASSGSVPSDTYARIGSRLCLKNRDLANYCGKQFIELWKDLCIGMK